MRTWPRRFTFGAMNYERSAVRASASSPPAHKTRPWLALTLPLVPLAAIVAVWAFGGLEHLRSPEQVAALAGSLRDSPAGLAYVLGAFAIGTALFLPVTALMLGTTLAFDPLRGFAYTLLGALLGACITYWAGRFAGSRALDYASGPRLTKFSEELRNHAFRASIFARLLPVGNFTAINLLAGSLRIPFRAFFWGNVVGIAPGALLFTLFAERITASLQAPNKQNLILLGVGAVLLAALVFLRRRWIKRRSGTREDASS